MINLELYTTKFEDQSKYVLLPLSHENNHGKLKFRMLNNVY